MNIAELLTEAAADRPQHPAFLFEDQALTYEALDRRTDRFGGVLGGLGLGAGDVAAIWLDSGPKLVVDYDYLGAIKAALRAARAAGAAPVGAACSAQFAMGQRHAAG